MHQPDGARRLPHGRRPAPRSGAIVGAEIERHADQRNVDPWTGRYARRAQQRGHVAEAGRHRGVHGPQAAVRVHGVLLGYPKAPSPATLTPVSTTQETHSDAGRNRILRNVRLRTARPCGAGRDPEDPARRGGHSAQVRRRRLRDHGGRQACLLEEGNRPLPDRRGNTRDPRLIARNTARGACRVTAARWRIEEGRVRCPAHRTTGAPRQIA